MTAIRTNYFFMQELARAAADFLSRELFRENIFFIRQKPSAKNRPVTKQ
jgi:hypothetical protein